MTDVLHHPSTHKLSTHNDAGVSHAGPRTCIRNVRAVTPNGIVDNATVTIHGGVIVEVTERGTPSPGAIDGRGAFLLPGLVDTHSEGLAKESTPLPSVQFPMDFAMRSFEGRARAAGITTIFHGIGFADDSRHALTVGLANSLCESIEHHMDTGDAIVDHRILYRLDPRDFRGFTALVKRIDGRTRAADASATREFPVAVPIVSFEDHTRAQGQYIAGTRKISMTQVREIGDELIAEREVLKANRERALSWLTQAAAAGAIRLMAHGPASAVDVDDADEWHATIAEFPTTMAAAVAAKERGMTVVCGAPNVLRGGSHSGNVSAQELVAADVCDVLASDYMPSTLLGAVAVLVDRGICGLAKAVDLVTGGPAASMGLRDRGRLAIGMRADLTLVSISARLATVRGVWSAEEVRA